MPSANGVYSLPSGYLAVTGTTIQASQHNPPLEDIAAALTLRLSRDGTAPMTGAVQFFSGTVSAPGAVFAADASSGFYKTTSGIGVAIGGVKIAEFLAGGINGARFIGELIPITVTAAPALTVLPFGQTLSRTTYALLWAVAQTEIAAGNTFYNNGDGVSTFGIGDVRGRSLAAWDKMGGSASGRLTTAGGGVDGTTLGAVGGAQTQTLTVAQLPTGISSQGNNTITVAAAGSNTFPVTGGSITNGLGGSGGSNGPLSTGTWGGSNSLSANNTINVTSNNTLGQAHPIMGPTMVVNCALYAGA